MLWLRAPGKNLILRGHAVDSFILQVCPYSDMGSIGGYQGIPEIHPEASKRRTSPRTSLLSDLFYTFAGGAIVEVGFPRRLGCES